MDSWQPLSSFANLPPASEGTPPPFPSTFAAPLTPEDSAPEGCAWEGVDSRPFLPAATGLIKKILANPVKTFQSMPGEGGLAKPLKFFVLVSWVTSTIALFYECTALFINPGMLAEGELKNLPQGGVFLIFFGLFLILPVILFFRAFVSAGIVHLALLLVGGARKPFEATFRVLCYSSGATSLLQAIPICGASFYLVASLIYSVIGLKEVHGTEIWRPILAMFLIFLTCAAVAIGVLALGFSAAGVLAK